MKQFDIAVSRDFVYTKTDSNRRSKNLNYRSFLSEYLTIHYLEALRFSDSVAFIVITKVLVQFLQFYLRNFHILGVKICELYFTRQILGKV